MGFRVSSWLLILCAASLFAQSETKRALLIGNAAYTSLPALPSSASGLDVMEKALRDSGFGQIRIERNLSYERLAAVEQEFARSLSPGDVCFIYFSGYAVQSGSDNYLLPIDFNAGARRQGARGVDLDTSAFLLGTLLDDIDQKKAGIRFVVIDNASTPALAAALPASKPGINLALSQLPNSVLASAGDVDQEVARSSGSEPSAFTSALVKAMSEPGLSPVDLFSETQKTVSRQTKGKQLPYFRPNAPGEFFFKAPKPPDPVEPPKTITVVKEPTKDELLRLVPQRSKTDRQDYVHIPAGTFKMGCVPASGKACLPEERPQHQVTITKGFWIGQTETTIAAYELYASQRKLKMPPGPAFDGKFKQKDNPMVEVSWEEASKFCQEAGGRLPTEAEWEYAARGGQADQVVPFNTETARERANFEGKAGNDVYDFTAPVKKFDKNGYGLYDMLGNVWEWCSDFFSKTYYADAPVTDPKGPESGQMRVIRGGSWFSDPNQHLRLSFRAGEKSSRSNKIGFRCVIEEAVEKRAF